MSFDLVIFGGTGDLAWRKLMLMGNCGPGAASAPVAHDGLHWTEEA
jgi:hypothetical protein